MSGENPELSGVERFVLRACAEAKVPIRLMQLDQYGLRNQWARHGYRGWISKELERCIDGLFEAGLLEIEDSEHPIAQKVLGLSKAGRTEWERCDKPNWRRFMKQRWSSSSSGLSRVSMMCGSPENRDKLTGALVGYYNLSRRFGLRGLRFKTIENWRATYWKSLPFGFFVSCLVLEASAEESFTDEQREYWRGLPDFYPWGRDFSRD